LWLKFGRKWVAIEDNNSVMIDFTSWTIRENEDRPQAIMENNGPAKTRLISRNVQSAQLGNRGGKSH
jgi:hypothetical protein